MIYRESAERLSRLLSSREVSSVEVVRSHLDRIEEVDGKVRAFTAVFRERALQEAAAADAARARGEARGPLHGLPVSVKESIDQAGLATTLGLASRADKPSARDAVIVTLLRERGAVILGRTNVSQMLLYHESRNPLFGQTQNPFGHGHTPGGSSGGEAAAIAAGMSPLGIGTDIGGSIRVPAHFSGVCGLKPTLDRWSNRGSQTAMPGQEAVRGQLGPMARHAGDLRLVMNEIDPRRMSELDPRVPPLPFGGQRPAVPSLRIGYYHDDGLVPASRAVVRAVEQTTRVLRGAGCEVVAFTPPDADGAIYQYFAALSADGGDTVDAALGKGEVDEVIRALRRLAVLPPALRSLVSRVAGMAGEKKVSRLLAATGRKKISELWKVTDAVRTYRFTLLEAMKESRIDLLVCPAHATPALPHGDSRDFVVAGSFSMLFNLVQMPAGVVPVTTVRADETDGRKASDRLERHAAGVDSKSAGLPVGVQVVGRPWEDELVLDVMATIEETARREDGYPVTPVG